MTLRQLMGHVAGVRNDGGDEGPLLSERCERPVDALQSFADSALLFEPGTQYRYSSYGWILVSAAVEAAADEPFLTFMRKQIFEPLGMNDTEGRLRDGADPGSRDALLPAVRVGSPLRPAPDARARLFLLCGIQRIPVHAVRPGALRHGDQQRQAAATRHGPIAPDVTATGLGAGDGLRSRLGPRDRRAGGQTNAAWSDTTGTSLGGMVASFMTFPEYGIVVSVTSNISYADTYSSCGENRGGLRGTGKRSSMRIGLISRSRVGRRPAAHRPKTLASRSTIHGRRTLGRSGGLHESAHRFLRQQLRRSQRRR